jgi:hypothetical protein
VKKKYGFILILAVAFALSASPESQSATIALNPTDDAGVWNWYPAGTINREYLLVSANECLSNPGNYDIARAYLKFDLGAIPDSSRILQAELRIYATRFKGGGVNFWHASSDNWTESGYLRITWDNQPAVDGFLAQLGVLDTLSSLKFVDITQNWDPTMDLMDDYLSIAIAMMDESPAESMQAEFVSQEYHNYPYYRPQLTIEYEEIAPAPLPGALWLFGSGFISVILYRRISRFQKSSL